MYVSLLGNIGYLASESVVHPPYFFANQFGDGVASVVGKSLHKVLQCEEELEHYIQLTYSDPLLVSMQLSKKNTPLQERVLYSK